MSGILDSSYSGRTVITAVDKLSVQVERMEKTFNRFADFYAPAEALSSKPFAVAHSAIARKGTLFYVDYLDYEIQGGKNIDTLAERLRYDLLLFAEDTLCMSVPACVKVQRTTELLVQLDRFWENERIVLQLDAKHDLNPRNYFNNRRRVLEINVAEAHLANHFEYTAYTNKRTNNFFGRYLPEMVNTKRERLYIPKKYETDALFRKNITELMFRHGDLFLNTLQSDDGRNFVGMVTRIGELANDNSVLFQRSLVEKYIAEESRSTPANIAFAKRMLDRAFALANADTSDAIPLSFVVNQLTGEWLSKLLRKTYGKLHDEICKLTWDEIYDLSNDQDWRRFVGYINSFIGLVQWETRVNETPIIELCLAKLSSYISSLPLLANIKDMASVMTSQQFCDGSLLIAVENAELMMDLYANYHRGKLKDLLNILEMTDILAQLLTIKLDADKRKVPNREYEQRQLQKGYEIFR